MVHHNLVVGAEDGQRFNMLFDEQKMDVGDHLGSCHRVGRGWVLYFPSVNCVTYFNVLKYVTHMYYT